jgi:flagellar protein FliS
MTTPRTSTIRAYRESEVLTASRERLLIITFDALVAALTRAKVGASMQNRDVCINGIDRARSILTELLVTLDYEQGGDLAKRLSGVYVFVLGDLDRLALRPEERQLQRHVNMMTELRNAFAQAAQLPMSGAA